MLGSTLFATLAFATLFRVTSGGIQFNPDSLCEVGWKYFMDFSGSQSCFRAVTRPLPWKQAHEHCQRDIAHLLNLDPIGRFMAFDPQTEFRERLTDYLFRETNGEFWSGMNVQSGRLMWDSYGPEYIRNNRIKSWVWAQGQPSQGSQESCGHVVQGRRSLQQPGEGSGTGTAGDVPTTLSPVSTTVTEVYDGTNSVKLTPCEKELPFVCQKAVPRQEVKITSFCPDGWIGNQYLPYCFRILKDPVSLVEAKKTCDQTTGGSMFQANPYTFKFTMASRVLDFYIRNDKYFESRPVPNVWVDGDQVDNKGQLLPQGRCYAVQEIIDSTVAIPVEVNCDQPLPFMCVRPTVKPDKINIDVISPYLNQDEVQAFSPFTTLPLTAEFFRAPSDNEVIFIHTPTRFINSSSNYIQEIVRFTDRSFVYNVTQSDRLISPYTVDIWLPDSSSQFENTDVPARKRRDLTGGDTKGGEVNRGNKPTNKKVSRVNDMRYFEERPIGVDTTHSGADDKQFMVELVSNVLSKEQSKQRRKQIDTKKRVAGVGVKSDNGVDKTSIYHDTMSIPISKKTSKINRNAKDSRKSIAKGATRNHNENTKSRLGTTRSKDISKTLSKTLDKMTDKRKNTVANSINRLVGKDYKKNPAYSLQKKKNYTGNKRRYTALDDAQIDGAIVTGRQKGKRSTRRKRQAPDFNPELGAIVNYDQVRLTTGYYSFGIYTINPPSYSETKPVLLRYAERDWYVYVVMVQLNPQANVLSDVQISSFNLYGDRSFIGIIGEYAFRAMETKPLLGIEGQEQPSPISYYKADAEIIIGQQVKFRVFMNVLDFLPGDVEQAMLPVLESHWRNGIAGDAFILNTLDVRSTVACSLEKVVVNNTIITFPSTRGGETGFTWERCFQGDGAFASRKCRGGYDDGVRWGAIKYNTGCQAFPVLNQSESTTNLKVLSEVELNSTNVGTVINDTIDLTSPDVNLTEADIIYTAEILYNYWQFEGAQPYILDDVYEVTNNVLERYPTIIDAAQKITNAANRIIESVEEITNNANLFGDDTLRIVKSFLATDIWDQMGKGNLVIGLKLHTEGQPDVRLNDTDLFTVKKPTDTDANVTDTAIYLDEELLKDKVTRTVFQIYSKTSLFTVVNSRRFELISKVAAARLEINGVTITDLGNNSVTAVFKPEKEDERTVCAFWDYRANEAAGGWDTEGCTKTVMSDKRIECRCNHLTNFAVLVDLEAYTISDTDKLILEIITKIGLIVSIIGLSLTVLTFLVFKHLRSGRGQQVLINLAVSMLCSSLIFLVGMDRTESKVGCKVVAALLHYFILVSFMWMLVEGILQYLRFVKVLGTYIPKFMIKTMIPAWGIPIIPVVVVAALDHDLYYGGNGYCWLARDAMLYAFIIPVAAILFANIIVFCLVLCNLFRRKSRGMKSNQSERKMAFLHFQAAVSIFVILGLTWVFGFLAIDGARVIFHYLFAILNAFQGFFIFLLFTAREKQIRKAWRKMCCKQEGKRQMTGSGPESVPLKPLSDTTEFGHKTSSTGHDVTRLN